MSKKKSEKPGKEKKQSAKKVRAKAVPPAAAPAAAGAAELKEAKSKTRKPKAVAIKKTSGTAAISSEDIKLRAYFIAERRHKMGWHGDSTGDWVEAERQLKAEAARKK
jgi:hypothetical protein